MTTDKPLRLWPGIAIITILLFTRLVLPALVPAAAGLGVIAGMVAALAVLIWWILFSRAPWPERIAAIVLIIAAAFAIRPFLHKSIATGMMGMMFFVYAIPSTMSVALVAWAVATRRLTGLLRWASLAAVIVAAGGLWTLLRTEGVTGDGAAQLAWRWTQEPEERLTALVVPPLPPPPAPASAKPAEPPPAAKTSIDTPPKPLPTDGPALWPGFRGSTRDGAAPGIRVKTDWTASPPVNLWRRKVGPGWSSFAASRDLVYTQEQRGEQEVVAGYRLSDGQPVWTHRDAARFWESNAGAGPRATPTLVSGRLYTLGATGIVNSLDAATGAVLWSRDAVKDTGAKIPEWGFAASPLVAADTVIVAASGHLAAYDLSTGAPRWTRKTGGGSYSSPHRLTIAGVPQILLLNNAGVAGHALPDGAPLWDHAWPGASMLQPALTPDGDLLITTGDMMGGVGTRRITVARSSEGWTATERWTSNGLKPYYNDLVVHNGHAFGFDGSILSCIDLADGKRKWKGGRYGHGQMLLLPDQDLLIVLSEEGDVALVAAARDKFTEIARFKAIEGKTWNHPALAGDVLLVRNSEEMAAFRLPIEGR